MKAMEPLILYATQESCLSSWVCELLQQLETDCREGWLASPLEAADGQQPNS